MNNTYGRPYITNYPNNINQQNLYEQNMYEQKDAQINQLQNMRNQIKNNATQNHQQPAINQTIQFAPNGNGGIKYVNSIDEVVKETVFIDTPFFSKDLSVLWIKKPSGEITAYELNEIVEKDEKDLQIEFLTAKISELEGMIKYEQPITNVNEQQTTTDTTEHGETNGEPVEKSKSTSVSRVSKSKKE